MSLVNETLGSETETRPRRLFFFRDQDRDRDLSKFSETETRPRPLKKGLETVSRPRRQDRDYIPGNKHNTQLYNTHSTINQS